MIKPQYIKSMKILIRLLLFTLVVNISIQNIQAQYKIFTVAGSYGGKIDASKVNITLPRGLTIDNSGNIYVAEEVIRKIDIATNESYILAGNGDKEFTSDGTLATKAGLLGTRAIRLDAQGTVYYTEGFRIRKIDPVSGKLVTVVGTVSGFSGDGGLATNAQISVSDFIIANNGDIFFSDSRNHRIRKVTAATGIITTIAGKGTKGYSGDAGLAINAELSSPGGMAKDSKGDIYFTDNHHIRKIDLTTNIISTVAGSATFGFAGDGGLASEAVLSFPNSLFIDNQDNIYISDGFNNRIRKVDATTQIITTIVGSDSRGFSGDGGLASTAQIQLSFGLYVNPSGDIIFSDNGNARIRKIDGTTNIITTIAGSGAGGLHRGYYGDGNIASKALFDVPSDIAMDSEGNQYIADKYNHRIRKIDALTKVVSTIAGTGESGYSGDGGLATSAQLDKPTNISVDLAGNVYLVDENNHCVRKIDKQTGLITTLAGDGTAGYSGDGSLATNARLDSPWGVLVDKNNHIYITDRGNHRVRKIDASSGIITTIVGTGDDADAGDGGLATEAQLKGPAGLAIDADNNLYICDTYAARVRKVDLNSGFISTVAGTGQFGDFFEGRLATSSRLAGPEAITVDQQGNLYICNRSRYGIYKVDATTKQMTTIVGTKEQGYFGDGDLATRARVNYPNGIVVAANQNVYFTDGFNHNIRKLTPEPRIALIKNNFNLADKASHRFDNTSYGVAKTVELAIKNTGLATLTVHNIKITGGFTLTNTPNGNLQPGESVSFTVTMPATSVGQQNGTLTIESNDLGSNIRTLSLGGLVYKAPQTIVFEKIPQKTYGDSDFTLTATGGESGNPVTFRSSDESILKVSGNQVSIVGAGSVRLYAEQLGNEFHNDAQRKSQYIQVKKATQYIEFSLGADTIKTTLDAPFALKVTKLTTNNQVIFRSSNWNVATIEGNIVTIRGVGTTNISALQFGDKNYSTSESVTHRLVVIPTTGLPENLKNAQLTIYPNPIKQVLNAKITGQISGNQARINILDLSGKQVIQTQQLLRNGQFRIPISNIKAGQYLIKISIGEETILRRIIKL